jgi:hypothetical protein
MRWEANSSAYSGVRASGAISAPHAAAAIMRSSRVMSRRSVSSDRRWAGRRRSTSTWRAPLMTRSTRIFRFALEPFSGGAVLTEIEAATVRRRSRRGPPAGTIAIEISDEIVLRADPGRTCCAATCSLSTRAVAGTRREGARERTVTGLSRTAQARRRSADLVLDVLLYEHKGHCEFFAWSLALLAGASAIPARPRHRLACTTRTTSAASAQAPQIFWRVRPDDFGRRRGDPGPSPMGPVTPAPPPGTRKGE